MSLYNKLKKIQWINYYILGPQNNSWYESCRNPLYGIKLAIGTKNINAHSIVDLRIGYIPYELIPENCREIFNVNMQKVTFCEKPYGVRKTIGEPWIRWIVGKLVIFELRKSHPIDACYLNGFLTFSFNLTNKWFPWISLNFRPIRDWMFNFGVGWEGVAVSDNPIAEVGLKCRITSYKKAVEWNPSCVAWDHGEGHI